MLDVKIILLKFKIDEAMNKKDRTEWNSIVIFGDIKKRNKQMDGRISKQSHK